MPVTVKYVLLGLLCAALFIFRIDLLLRQEANVVLLQYADTTAVIVGVVADDPDSRTTGIRVTINAVSINSAPGSGRLLATLPPGSQVDYGDTLELRGLIELPQAFETNTGRLFDYTGYLKARGISAVMQHANLRSVTPGGPSILGALYSFKHAFEKSLERALPEPQASLLEGILLGERGGLSQALLQMFVVVGIIHIVVLSGSNIAIVSEGVFRLLGSFLPRRAVYVAGAAAMVLFVLMTGSAAASVRALSMGGIAILARFLRRPALALRSLIAAGVLMTLWNPLVLLDNGFVLSVLATFGLIALGPAIESRLQLLPAWKKFNLRSIVATTLAVEVFILPALLYYSGVLSIVAVPANALVLPIVPLVMLAGFVTGLAGLIHPALALLPGLVTDVLLRLVLFVTQVAAAVPFAATIVAPFSPWLAVLVYLPLTFVALKIYSRTRTS